MNWKHPLSLVAVLALGGAAAYFIVESGHDHSASGGHGGHGHAHGAHGHGTPAEPAEAKGPHLGRLLRDGDFTLELAIFERGTPPEFRAWFRQAGQPLPPAAVQLTVQLTRPGGKIDEHRFAPSGDFVRSPDAVYEPHSFSYKIIARHGDRLHRWEFAAPEMQTTFPADVAQRSGVATALAGPATLSERLAVYGSVKLNANRLTRAVPRFGGLVREARKSLGDPVAAGEVVAVLETNQTLTVIEVRAPLAGVIIEREVHAGQTVAEGATLYVIADLSEVWVDLHIPKRDSARVKVGQAVTLHADDGGPATAGTISWLSPFGDAAAQTLIARVVLTNPDARWRPGLSLKADIAIAEFSVPIAVKESGLQTLFAFTVVFTQHGDVYQARPLELGRRSGGYVEVLQGLAAGESYVTENSFLLKADIGKSGASHDH